MKPRLIVSLQRLTEAAFQTKAGFIIARLTGNANYPEPWPAQVSSLTQLNESLDVYRTGYHDSATRDTLKIRARHEARDALTRQLQQLATYLEMMAQGDAKMLESTGYDLRSEPSRAGANAETLPAPGDFRVARGRESGTLSVHVAHLPGAASYEVFISPGNATATEEWTHAITAASGARMLLEALTPGQSYWLRVRAVGKKTGAGLWTEPIKMMVA